MTTDLHRFMNAPTRRVAVSTLGCKVNAYESELIAQSLQRSGWSVVPDSDAADLYIVNTCTVTREADRQARQTVRRAVRRNPRATVIVTGCYAQISPDTCAAIPGVDFVIGNDRKLEIDKLLPQLATGATPGILVGDLDQHVSLPADLLTGFEDQTRAFVQIQQGCNQGCTFCIIHVARGPSRSLTPTQVMQQVTRLADTGYREIVLCGVDLGAYGQDLELEGGRNFGLENLLAELCGIDLDFRIRLSSLDPAHITDGLIDLMAGNPRICPQLHLSLQSGNTLILKRMKRRYNRDLVYARVKALRSRIPHLVLSADLMVGFPTENHDQFQDSVSMVNDLRIAYPHVFPYSERSGTPAAKIPQSRQVPVHVRKSRAAELREAGRQIRSDLLRSRIGARDRVLIEGSNCARPSYQRARAADYIECWLPVEAGRAGDWADVVYESVQDDALIARTAA